MTENTSQAAGHTLPTVSDDDMRARLGGVATYTAVLLHRTDAYAKPGADRIVWEHGRRNMALSDVGLLAVVLPIADDTPLAGIAVFAANVDQTRAIMDDDPGVQAGIFRYDIHPARGFPGAALP